MIIGIGTDIIEIERVVAACAGKRFLEKFFTESERVLIADRGERAAGNFACKEAVAKALGTGFSGFSLKDVEVLRDDAGKPVVKLHGGALERFNAVGGACVHVSVSHCKAYAAAFAVVEGGL